MIARILLRPIGVLCAAAVCLCSAAAVSAAPIEWPVAEGGNGHFYELKSFSFMDNWTTLPGCADDFSFGGVAGHVATVLSAAENQFILDAFGTGSERLIFLGGNDADMPGQWYWQDGPEAGTPFWDEQTATTTTYANWEPGQPNRTDVHYLAMSLKTGGWYDTNNGGYSGGPVSVNGYLVEYSVPEPATLSLLALGAAAGMRRRRRP